MRVIDSGSEKAIADADLRGFMHQLSRGTILRCHWTRPNGDAEDWLCITLGKRGRYPAVHWSHRAAQHGDDIDPDMSHVAGAWTHLRDEDGDPTFIVESIPASTYIGDIRTLEVVATSPM